MLVSALNGDVFDIKGNSTAAGAVVQSYPSKASGINLLHPGVQTLASNHSMFKFLSLEKQQENG